MTLMIELQWVAVCELDRLEPERGVAALVDGVQVALFRTFDGDLYATGNRDPKSGAQVMSRGIVGTRRIDGVDVPTVASPLFKQVYDLRSGDCLDQASLSVPSYPVRVIDGVVHLAVSSPPNTGPRP